jgi:SAM-dependent methyltransferase
MKYETRIKQQIDQYSHIENLHESLNNSGQFYKDKFNKNRVLEIFNAKSHFEFYALPFMRALRNLEGNKLLSLGSGDGSLEIGIAKILEKNGFDFEFFLTELSDFQINRAKLNVVNAGFENKFHFTKEDLNFWKSDHRYAGVMAHHSLHHIVNLENLFDKIAQSLDGYFCTIDMIGRNGHMRWPEVLEIINLFWAILPLDKRKHKALPNFEETFQNFDCSKKGFEGIRSQDILPCLLNRFGFESFYAFGGLIDPFIGRGFGHHYDVTKNWDRSFIELIGNLNDILIDCGHIKPTQMFAVMTKNVTQIPAVFRARTPEFCIRKPTI